MRSRLEPGNPSRAAWATLAAALGLTLLAQRLLRSSPDAEDVVQFLRDTTGLARYVDEGAVSLVTGKDRSRILAGIASGDVDRAFVESATEGYAEFESLVERTDWNVIESAAGVPRDHPQRRAELAHGRCGPRRPAQPVAGRRGELSA